MAGGTIVVKRVLLAILMVPWLVPTTSGRCVSTDHSPFAAETTTNTVGALEDWTNGTSAADRLAARDAAAGAAKSTTGESAATGFRGSEGFELKNAPYQQVRNADGEVNGQAYSGHAFDQMQNRGIMPSVVQNTIQTGSRFATRAGTTGYYDAANNGGA